jgi:hypothetical protein
MDVEMMRELVQEVEDAAPSLTWSTLPPGNFPSALSVKGYQGRNGQWVITLMSFDVSDQGFPEGSRGYDGIGMKKGVVLRLPREMAASLFARASAEPAA